MHGGKRAADSIAEQDWNAIGGLNCEQNAGRLANQGIAVLIVAVHAGLRVLGLSIITDMCIPEELEPASLEKIIATANKAEPNLTAVVRGVLERM